MGGFNLVQVYGGPVHLFLFCNWLLVMNL